MTTPRSGKRKVLVALSLVLAGGILVVGGLAHNGCQTEPNEVGDIDPNVTKTLGDAHIILYAKNQKIVLDPNSAYFAKLHVVCEEMLISAESLYFDDERKETSPKAEEVKNEEWVIEFSYVKPIEVRVPLGMGPTTAIPTPIKVSQFLIPLTGKWSCLKATGVISFEEGAKEYVCLFILPEITLGKLRWEGLIGTKKNIQEIKNILARLDVKVP
jgi:hypothetical protein